MGSADTTWQQISSRKTKAIRQIQHLIMPCTPNASKASKIKVSHHSYPKSHFPNAPLSLSPPVSTHVVNATEIQYEAEIPPPRSRSSPFARKHGPLTQVMYQAAVSPRPSVSFVSALGSGLSQDLAGKPNSNTKILVQHSDRPRSIYPSRDALRLLPRWQRVYGLRRMRRL